MSDTTLARWIEEEKAVIAQLEAGPGPGVPSFEQTEGKTGLDVMQDMIAGRLPYAAIAQTLDFTVMEVRPGVALFQGTPLAKHLNPLGTVHGGWVATLLDSALAAPSTR